MLASQAACIEGGVCLDSWGAYRVCVAERFDTSAALARFWAKKALEGLVATEDGETIGLARRVSFLKVGFAPMISS